MQSIEYLVLRMRGEDPELPKRAPTCDLETGTENIIAARILDNWATLSRSGEQRCTHDDRIGMLRTLLHSIPIRTRYHGGPRGYLGFIARLMGKGGVIVQRMTPADHEAGQEEHGYDEETD